MPSVTIIFYDDCSFSINLSVYWGLNRMNVYDFEGHIIGFVLGVPRGVYQCFTMCGIDDRERNRTHR